MGCNSDYMKQTNSEAEFQATAKNLLFVLTKLGKPIPDRLYLAAKDGYCKEDFVKQLCDAIKALSPDDLEAIVYNGRSAESRALATWWDRHQEADRVRMEAYSNEATRRATAAIALSKLTLEERIALGVHLTERLR